VTGQIVLYSESKWTITNGPLWCNYVHSVDLYPIVKKVHHWTLILTSWHIPTSTPHVSKINCNVILPYTSVSLMNYNLFDNYTTQNSFCSCVYKLQTTNRGNKISTGNFLQRNSKYPQQFLFNHDTSTDKYGTLYTLHATYSCISDPGQILTVQIPYELIEQQAGFGGLNLYIRFPSLH
jgi:hypothetical protein